MQSDSSEVYKKMDIARENSYPTPLAFSPLLPLLLASLQTQKSYPTQLEDVTTILSEYDYIIVGAGTAGSTLAGRLSELPCVSILLLEAGPTPPIINDVPTYVRSFWFTDLDWTYKTTPQNHTGKGLINQQVIFPAGKGIGGSTLLSEMMSVRGNKKNYNDWKAHGAIGWGYKDVLPYFKKLEDNRNSSFFANGYHGVGGPVTVENPPYSAAIKAPVIEAAESMGYHVVDSNGKRQTGFYDLQLTTRRSQRCSTAKSYLVPAEFRRNLHILPNAFVTKVLIKDKRATGVKFEVNGTIYEVMAKREVIMSAGTTNTAQLLMLSGIGPRKDLEKHKIPVVADLPVGRNLQDHCSAVMTYELGDKPANDKPTEKETVDEYIKNRTGLLTENAALLAFLNSKSDHPAHDNPNFELYFSNYDTSLPKHQIGLKPEVYEQVYGPYENKQIYVCLSQILQPKSRGSVELNSSDPHDPPLINPNYFEHPQDLDDVVQGMKVCQRIATSSPLKKIGSKLFNTTVPGCKDLKSEDDYLKCQATSFVVTMSHQVGTAKMGDLNDPSTVVGPDLKVKYIHGLRVVDASVMPIIPSGNTHIPTIMLAEKASDIIKNSIHRCRSESVIM